MKFSCIGDKMTKTKKNLWLFIKLSILDHFNLKKIYIYIHSVVNNHFHYEIHGPSIMCLDIYVLPKTSI